MPAVYFRVHNFKIFTLSQSRVASPFEASCFVGVRLYAFGSPLKIVFSEFKFRLPEEYFFFFQRSLVC